MLSDLSPQLADNAKDKPCRKRVRLLLKFITELTQKLTSGTIVLEMKAHNGRIWYWGIYQHGNKFSSDDCDTPKWKPKAAMMQDDP